MTDLHELAMKIRYDLTSAQGRLTDLIKAVDALEIEARPPVKRCPGCEVGEGQLHAVDCPVLQLSLAEKALTEFRSRGAA